MRARYWLPAGLWICIIFLASTDPFSATNTAPWLETVLRTIAGHALAPEEFQRVHFIVRKCAHLTEYGILGALLFRAIRGDRLQWNIRWSAMAVLIAAMVSSLDEWHQTFVPSRTGTVKDVILDTVGATLAQILIRIAQVLFFKT